MLDRTKQKICLSAGFVSFGLGIIGLFLPIMPTTPFILLATFFFSKGSEKWHKWLLSHPQFGPLIKDWHSHGVIRKKTKLVSSVLILGSVISVSVFVPLLWVKVSILFIFAFVLIFIWTRPSEPKSNS